MKRLKQVKDDPLVSNGFVRLKIDVFQLPFLFL